MNHRRLKVPRLPHCCISCLVVMLGFSSEKRVVFEDVTEKTGITWVHENGMSPERYLPETMNGGCAFLDYDNDGWIDIPTGFPVSCWTPQLSILFDLSAKRSLG